MTVKQLILQLQQYPENMDVYLAQRVTEFAYGLANSTRTQQITFEGNPDFDEDGEVATEEVVIIDEE